MDGSNQEIVERQRVWARVVDGRLRLRSNQEIVESRARARRRAAAAWSGSNQEIVESQLTPIVKRPNARSSSNQEIVESFRTETRASRFVRELVSSNQEIVESPSRNYHTCTSHCSPQQSRDSRKR